MQPPSHRPRRGLAAVVVATTAAALASSSSSLILLATSTALPPPIFAGALAAPPQIVDGGGGGGNKFLPNLGLELPFLAAEQPVAAIDRDAWSATIERVRSDWAVPGVSVAVVRGGGDIIFAEGFGSKGTYLDDDDDDNNLDDNNDGGNVNASNSQAVTNRTIFQIGSLTKAFVAFAVGKAVEDGTLAWTDKLANRRPGLRLPDPVAQAHANLIDAMVHRTGAPRHDLLMFFHDTADADLANLDSLPQALEFRDRFLYNNHMYGIVGEILSNATGVPLGQLLHTHVFGPLGMRDTVFPLTASGGSPDVAAGHTAAGKRITRDADLVLESLPAAGSIVSSCTDMARWLSLVLNRGSLGNETLIAPNVIDTLLTPRVIVNREKGDYTAYAPGWNFDRYREKRRMVHTGGMVGFSSLAMVFPDDDLAIIVLTNTASNPVASVVANTLVDSVLFPDAPTKDWNAVAHAGAERAAAARRAALQQLLDLRNPAAPPTLPSLAAYTGRFSHPAYGTLLITLPVDGDPNYNFNLSATVPVAARLGRVTTLSLNHWFNDSFAVYFHGIFADLGDDIPPADDEDGEPVPAFLLRFVVTPAAPGAPAAVVGLAAPLDPDAPPVFFRSVDAAETGRVFVRQPDADALDGLDSPRVLWRSRRDAPWV
ncbi:beta-lactamase/transpeptidase-like protein [Zopfochytrium polystomum]|nr:beta-lactamase/transpeptidase-like protein [Zopfochytrium polystomum]